MGTRPNDRVTAPEPQDGAHEDRVLTVPNLVTLVRLLCLPWFLWLLFAQDDRYGAAILLGCLGATDWVDGYIARRFDQVSTFGKILDPVTDRLLFFVGAGGILIDGSVPAWFAIAVLAREALVSVATLTLAALGARRIDVTWFGKAGTFGLMMAFPFFLVAASNAFWNDIAQVGAWVTGIPGLVLSYYALALYVPIGLQALRDGRAARHAGS